MNRYKAPISATFLSVLSTFAMPICQFFYRGAPGTYVSSTLLVLSISKSNEEK